MNLPYAGDCRNAEKTGETGSGFPGCRTAFMLAHHQMYVHETQCAPTHAFVVSHYQVLRLWTGRGRLPITSTTHRGYYEHQKEPGNCEWLHSPGTWATGPHYCPHLFVFVFPKQTGNWWEITHTMSLSRIRYSKNCQCCIYFYKPQVW